MTRADIVIVGGGIAGLWLRALLHARGYDVLTLERHALGHGQTGAAQGIVHGGLKYAVGRSPNAASEALAGMPARWRAHLAGRATPDLAGLVPASEHVHLLVHGGVAARAVGFLADKALHGGAERVGQYDIPHWLPRDYAGSVYRLQDFVLEPHALLARLLAASDAPVLHARVERFARASDGVTLRVRDEVTGAETDVSAQRVILCAGAGTADLLSLASHDAPAMQLRPLRQAWVRGAGWPAMFAHVVQASSLAEPRLTIVHHANSAVWSIGGAVATRSVAHDATAHAEYVRAECSAALPWLPSTRFEVASTVIDRAEPRVAGRRRPDDAFLHVAGPLFTCWPTKLALAPALGDRVLAALDASPLRARPVGDRATWAAWSRATLAAPPWDNLEWN